MDANINMNMNDTTSNTETIMYNDAKTEINKAKVYIFVKAESLDPSSKVPCLKGGTVMSDYNYYSYGDPNYDYDPCLKGGTVDYDGNLEDLDYKYWTLEYYH